MLEWLTLHSSDMSTNPSGSVSLPINAGKTIVLCGPFARIRTGTAPSNFQSAREDDYHIWGGMNIHTEREGER